MSIYTLLLIGVMAPTPRCYATRVTANLPGNLPDAAVRGIILPCSSLLHHCLGKLHHNFCIRAAGRTCRLLVFKEVHLTSFFSSLFLNEIKDTALVSFS